MEFYHFLCHKSPRLCSLRFDQSQHFCLYALLKCCTLHWLRHGYIYPEETLKFNLLVPTQGRILNRSESCRSNVFGSTPFMVRKDVISLSAIHHLSILKPWRGFSSILCESGICVIQLSSLGSHLIIISWLLLCSGLHSQCWDTHLSNHTVLTEVGTLRFDPSLPLD